VIPCVGRPFPFPTNKRKRTSFFFRFLALSKLENLSFFPLSIGYVSPFGSGPGWFFSLPQLPSEHDDFFFFWEKASPSFKFPSFFPFLAILLKLSHHPLFSPSSRYEKPFIRFETSPFSVLLLNIRQLKILFFFFPQTPCDEKTSGKPPLLSLFSFHDVTV